MPKNVSVFLVIWLLMSVCGIVICVLELRDADADFRYALSARMPHIVLLQARADRLFAFIDATVSALFLVAGITVAYTPPNPLAQQALGSQVPAIVVSLIFTVAEAALLFRVIYKRTRRHRALEILRHEPQYGRRATDRIES